MELASSPSVVIRARGNNISTAVTASRILLRKTNNTYKISDVKLGEDEMDGDDGKKRNVSTIQIMIEKKLDESRFVNDNTSENQSKE